MSRLILLTAACASLLLSACETVKGVGKDLQNASEAVQSKF